MIGFECEVIPRSSQVCPNEQRPQPHLRSEVEQFERVQEIDPRCFESTYFMNWRTMHKTPLGSPEDGDNCTLFPNFQFF